MESLPPVCFQTIGRILFRFPYLTRNVFIERLFLRRHLPAFQEQPKAEEGDSEGSADFSEAVVLPIEDSIDLHTFAPGEIPEVVKEYLEQVYEKGFQEVRIIHGRGIGVQRDRVRRLLDGHPLVVNFSDAPPERGGWGATVVRLKIGERP
jgi:DNA-nicking Smr family endonuclease